MCRCSDLLCCSRESCRMIVCWLQLCGGTCSTVSVKTPDSWSSWWSTSANRWVGSRRHHAWTRTRTGAVGSSALPSGGSSPALPLLPSPVQVQFIDSLNGEDLLLTGEVRWRPLLEQNAQSILKVASPTYNDAGL